MNNRKNIRTLSRFLAPTLLAAALLSPSPSHATPYATSVTNNGTTISFRLNESGIVTLQYTNLAAATVTSNLNLRAAGLTVTNVAIPGAFSIIVAKTNTAGYISGVNLPISADGTNGVATNTMRYNSPRGVAVNTNPASAYFGRIYVANSAAGFVAGGTATIVNTNRGDGIYMLNADYSDAVGQGTNARNAGLPFTPPLAGDDANTPFRIEVGEDNNIYIADTSTNSAGIWTTDPDVITGTNVIAGLGFNGNGLSPSANHGRIISSVFATGSTNTGDLVVYAIDTDNTTTSDFGPNHIMKWGVGAGPLPVDLTVGTALTNMDEAALLPVSNIAADLARGPDGKFYPLQYRLVDGNSGIFVVDPATDINANGLADVVYSSLDATTATYGSTRDFFFASRAVAISPDGKYIAVVRDDNQVLIASLTNGIPDLSSRRLLANGSLTTLGRDISFDAAGNLYVTSSSQQILRVFTPGYITRATTTWSPSGPATFSMTNITPNEVKILATSTNAAEPNVNGSFTFYRSGDLSNPLTVNYIIGGTAARGADYQTNVFGFTSATVTNTVTFAAGVASTNVDILVIDDSIGEVVETVNFTLVSSTNYVSANNQAATVWIADDGIDLPNVNVKALGLGFNELLTNRPAKFVVSISSVWNVDITANVSLTGTAVSGVDYSNPNSFTLTIPQGQTLVTNLVYSIDNATIDPDKTLIYNILSGTGYTNLGAISTNIALRNDDLATLPVLFSDDFETNSAPIWRTNAVSVDNDATFSYDYSLDGIPAAPHTPGGATTKGLKIRAHTAGVASPATGIGASPIGLVLTNDYRLRFDAWLNYNGPAPVGGTSSSQFLGIGMGVSELRTNVAGNSAGTPIAAWNNLPGSAVIFTADGDGGFVESTGDYVAYTGNTPVALSTNVYPANSRDAGAAYYGEFGDIVIPAAQTTVAPTTQTGYAGPGTLAFTWHDVIATKVGNLFTLDIDGLRVINLTYATPLVGSNFSVGYIDENTSFAPTAQLQMNAAIIDNLIVEKLALSTNANLASLILTPGTLVPSFSAGTLTYEATNGLGTNYTVTAAVSHPSATLQLNVNGGGFTSLTSGVASGTLALNAGANTVVVRVTAPDATTVQDYTLNAFMFSTGPNLSVPTLTNSLSGSALTLSWPADHIGFNLQAQTNALSTGLTTNWFNVAGSASTNTVTITVDPTKPTVFYRLVYP